MSGNYQLIKTNHNGLFVCSIFVLCSIVFFIFRYFFDGEVKLYVAYV